MRKIRWSYDHLIFLMEIPVPAKIVFIMKQGPQTCHPTHILYVHWSALVSSIMFCQQSTDAHHYQYHGNITPTNTMPYVCFLCSWHQACMNNMVLNPGDRWGIPINTMHAKICFKAFKCSSIHSLPGWCQTENYRVSFLTSSKSLTLCQGQQMAVLQLTTFSNVVGNLHCTILKQGISKWLLYCHQWPLLQTWFNFNPSMDK